MSASDEQRIVYVFEGYRLDPSRRQLFLPDGAPAPVRGKVLDTLLVLVRNAGRPVAKRDLMEAVWPGSFVEENNLNQSISALRQLFGDDRQSPLFIATIVGKGYQFVAPVTEEAAPATADAGSTRWDRKRVATVTALAGLLAVAVAWAIRSILTPQGIVQVRLDSSRLVTDSAGSYTAPTLSPDGQRIAYLSNRSGTAQIWVQRVSDYASARPLTHGEQPARAPSWSPDRDLIVFQRALGDGTPAAWLVDADGTQAPRVLVADARRPRFSTGGDRVVFDRGPGEIFSMPLDGTTPRRIADIPQTAGFADPSAAMNGTGSIAFVHAEEGPSGHLWLYRSESETFERLTEPGGRLSGRWVESPAWHPDGRHLFYVASLSDSFDSHLWQVNVDSGESVQISSGVAGYGTPSVSGDGRYLAYSFARPLWQLVATDPDTGSEEVLLERRQPIIFPKVSPDGDQVVFFNEAIHTLPVSGGPPTRRTFGDAVASLPTWSRSDQSIHYYRDRTLHRIDPSTAATELVIDDFHWSSRNWLAVHGKQLAFRERPSLISDPRTVILNLETGQRVELEAEVRPMDWSRDGTALLGVRPDGQLLTICAAPRFDCRQILHQGEPIPGARPRWSADESAIYFRRARQDRAGYAWIWRVNRDGSDMERTVEIGPYDRDTMSFGLTRDDRIIWNRYDSHAGSEIWVTDIPDPAAD